MSYNYVVQKNKLFKKIILAFLGCIFLSFGIGLTTNVGIGVDALSAVYVGISNKINISLGFVVSIINLLLLIVVFFVNKKYIGIASVLYIFCSSFFVNLATLIPFSSKNIFVSIILYIIASSILALGSELFIFSGLGAIAYDALTLCVGKLFNHKIKYVYIRYACDAVCLIVAIMLKGAIGIGTIISWFLIGILMKMWQTVLEKYFKLKID